MTSKYFDAAASIAGYEKTTGIKASEYLVELVQKMEVIINMAYRDGFAAGLREAGYEM